MPNPQISVVIATCDRIRQLTRLLHIVQSQDCDSFEVIVIDDCSSADTREQYEALWDGLDHRFRLHLRSANDGRPRGPGASRNVGIELARGSYAAFCDDDDKWIRDDHLSCALQALETNSCELYFSNMQTSDGGEVDNPDWYGVGQHAVASAQQLCNSLYKLNHQSIGEILKHRILHANTLVVSKNLLTRIGMYWEKIGFAEDHNFAFRVADAARGILFRSEVTADLDVTTHPSVARRYQEDERLLFSILAVLHAEASIRNPILKKIARGNRAWRLLELAALKRGMGQRADARNFSLQALLLKPSLSALRLLLKTSLP
jgi:hypothetical protein